MASWCPRRHSMYFGDMYSITSTTRSVTTHLWHASKLTCCLSGLRFPRYASQRILRSYLCLRVLHDCPKRLLVLLPKRLGGSMPHRRQSCSFILRLFHWWAREDSRHYDWYNRCLSHSRPHRAALPTVRNCKVDRTFTRGKAFWCHVSIHMLRVVFKYGSSTEANFLHGVIQASD